MREFARCIVRVRGYEFDRIQIMSASLDRIGQKVIFRVAPIEGIR